MDSDDREYYVTSTQGLQQHANDFEVLFAFLQLPYSHDWVWSLSVDAEDEQSEHGYPCKLLGISECLFMRLGEGGGEGGGEVGGEGGDEGEGGANEDRKLAEVWAALFCRGVFDPEK
jgi:hypothetical protein